MLIIPTPILLLIFVYRSKPHNYDLFGVKEIAGLKRAAYARYVDTGGARGGKGLDDERDSGEYIIVTTGEYFSVARKLKVGCCVTHGSIFDFTID